MTRSSTEDTSISAKARAFCGPTPRSSSMPCSASELSFVTLLLDAEEIGIQRLAAVMNLGGDGGPMLVKPFRQLAGGGHRRPVSLDDGDDLVAIADQRAEQLTRGGG